MPFGWRFFFPLQFCLVKSPHCPNLELKTKIIKDVSQRNLNSRFFRQTPGTLMHSEVDNEEIRKHLDFTWNSDFLMQFPVPLSSCLTLSTLRTWGTSPVDVARCYDLNGFLTNRSLFLKEIQQEGSPKLTSAAPVQRLHLTSSPHSPDMCNWVVELAFAINLTSQPWETCILWTCATATLVDCFWRLTSAFMTGKPPSIMK